MLPPPGLLSYALQHKLTPYNSMIACKAALQALRPCQPRGRSAMTVCSLPAASQAVPTASPGAYKKCWMPRDALPARPDRRSRPSPPLPLTTPSAGAIPQQLAVRLSATESSSTLAAVNTLVLDCDGRWGSGLSCRCCCRSIATRVLLWSCCISPCLHPTAGVLWRGSELMPDTVEALSRFRQQGKRLLFLTNNSSKSRRAYRAKFESLGIEVAPEEIVPTSYAAAAYLQSIGFDNTVFLIGNEGVAEELEDAGIEFRTFQQICADAACSSGDGISSGSDSSAEVFRAEWSAETFGALQLDPSIGAVVIGWDPTFDYHKLCYASACLRELSGCLFVATNLDDADRMGALVLSLGVGG